MEVSPTNEQTSDAKIEDIRTPPTTDEDGGRPDSSTEQAQLEAPATQSGASAAGQSTAPALAAQLEKLDLESKAEASSEKEGEAGSEKPIDGDISGAFEKDKDNSAKDDAPAESPSSQAAALALLPKDNEKADITDKKGDDEEGSDSESDSDDEDESDLLEPPDELEDDDFDWDSEM